MKERIINPYTDFGFKNLLGEEASKELLIDFLNEVLKGEHIITELNFRPTEQFGNSDSDRKAIFDLYCIGLNGESFIVEMQKKTIPYT